MTPEVVAAAALALSALRARGWMAATAESCTGGLIAAALTEVAGSSDVMDRGFVTYSNAAKSEMLGVDPKLIALHGAVSGQVAAAMAAGALERSNAALAIAVTGVAGPGGGLPEKPVGTVWFGLAVRGRPPVSDLRTFPGDRTGVREAAARHALALVRNAAQD